MRKVGNNIIYTKSWDDPIGEGIITIFYKLPTVIQRVKYLNEVYSQNGEKIIMNPNTRLFYGGELAIGIGENQLCDENDKPISSNEKDENYNPEWKKLAMEVFPECFMSLAYSVFEGVKENNEIKKNKDEVVEVNIKGGSGTEPDSFQN